MKIKRSKRKHVRAVTACGGIVMGDVPW